MSLTPAPIRAFADIETLGPICFTTAERYIVINSPTREKGAKLLLFLIICQQGSISLQVIFMWCVPFIGKQIAF